MNYKFLFLTQPKVMRIMKYVGNTPITISQISKGTKIPLVTTYRLVDKLEKNEYLISDEKERGRRYWRGIKYKIIITPDGAILRRK